MRLARLVAASAALSIVAAGLAANAIAAPPVDSNLVANPTAVTVNVWSDALADPPHSTTVEVRLDENCARATDATEYTIAAGDTGGFFTVTPAVSGPLDCTESAIFTITGLAVTPEAPAPATSLHFSPIGKNDGVQKKLGSGVDVQVTVVDTTPDGGPPPCTTDCPVPGARPAAPAVANGLLNMDAALVQACKDTFKTKNWRGRVISTIADTMPKPTSVKDDTTVFETDDDWIAFVKNGSPAFSGFSSLYNLCRYSEAPSV